MATSRDCAAALFAATLLLVPTVAAAEKPLEAGRGLLTLDGQPWDFEAAVHDSRATVLVFWSAECPCVRRYQARVEALTATYGPKGVKVLGIASNAGEEPAKLQRALHERGVTLEVLRDPGGRLAEAIGARSTPTVAVLDPKGAIVFLGWIDNEREPGTEGREPWLERALDALLAGKRGGFARRSPTYGCRITRKLFGAAETPSCHPVP